MDYWNIFGPWHAVIVIIAVVTRTAEVIFVILTVSRFYWNINFWLLSFDDVKNFESFGAERFIFRQLWSFFERDCVSLLRVTFVYSN